MKKASTYIFSVLVTLLLIAVLIATAGLHLMKYRALSAGTCLQLMQTERLPERVHLSLEKYYTEQENTSGIPLAVYADSITEAQCEKHMRELLSYTFNGLNAGGDETGITYNPDFSELETDMTAFFEDYAEKNDYEKDEKYQQTLQKAIDNAKSYIEQECDVFRSQTLREAGLLDKVKKYVPWISRGLIACAASSVVLFVLLLIINRKEKGHVWYWLGNALLVASILGLIPTVWLNVTRWFDKFAVKTDQIFAAVTGYLYGLTHAAATICGIGIVLAFCCYVVFMIQHRMHHARTNGR